MKKVLSVVMALIMAVTSMLGFGITANAGVYYDTDKLSDTKAYKALTIYGTNHYKYAFDCLNRVNSVRAGNGLKKLRMDADLLEAAMLRAHELVAHYAIERPNGESTEFIVDSESNQIYYMMFCTSNVANFGSAAADYLVNSDSNNILAGSNEIQSAGVGSFESEETGFTYWVIFVSLDKAKKAVVAGDYATSKKKTEKIALYKDYVSEWSENHKHTYLNTSVATVANASKKTNGKMNQKCKTCAATRRITIYYPKTVTLSTTTYTYNGKVRKPSVTVKDSKGRKISSSYYTVSYAKGRKNVGKYAVKIKFKTRYSGTLTRYFTIRPTATTLSSVTAGKRAFTARWKKKTAQVTGYQIQYSTSSKFSKASTKTASKNSITAKKVTKLKSGKKYYVRVRTYKTVGKTKYYSAWSKSKAVKVK